MADQELQALLEQKAAEYAPHFQPGFLNRDHTLFQFKFGTGSRFYLEVTRDRFRFTPGEVDQPTLSLFVVDHKTCWGLLDGTIDGMQAFMESKYRADGNIVLSQLLLYLFKSNDPTIAYEIQY
jgi:putative sterol carrier protein